MRRGLVFVVGPSRVDRDSFPAYARSCLAANPEFRPVRRHITFPETEGGDNHCRLYGQSIDSAGRIVFHGNHQQRQSSVRR